MGRSTTSPNHYQSRFVLIGEALKLATEAGLTGWEAGQGKAAVTGCMAEWLDRYGPGNRKDVQILEQTEGWFALHGWSRFIDITALDEREPNVPNCAGYTGNGSRAGVWSGWSVPACCALKSHGATTRPMRPGCMPGSECRELVQGAKLRQYTGYLGYMLRCVSTNSWLSSDLGRKPKPLMRRKKV
ncbi:hypothetical protein LHGZ1_2217 [Laribacter hongkongensis]|uniref:Uncharacterized protein n=2 Tax=Laribacter hongkongensis TaxID=168471 RepID=A0A248LJY2_9NEIS|nr:hypothetical protein LHGZ1_2217 [Laribacter hongkongensis]